MRTPYNPNQSPRVIIIQKLYGNFFNDDTDLTFPKHRFKKFIKDVVLGTIERDEVIKEEVKNHLSEDLQLTNLDKVFQVIVKSAIFEFLYKPKVSTKIIIKEYLDASNFFLEDAQTKYLNAILDKIAKKIRTTMHEFELIKNYFQKLSKKSPSALNLNDDVFFDKKNKLVVSVDTYTEGNHFIDFKKPELVIKKIIRSSISDLICKGVKPKYYFISGSGNKKSFSKLNLSKISKSLNQEQNKYKIFLSGGDTVFSNKLSFTITSIGFANNIVYRNKAKINDDIYVSGNLGDSYLGLLVLKNKIKLNNLLKNILLINILCQIFN